MLARALPLLVVPTLCMPPQDPAPASPPKATVVHREVHGFDVRLVNAFAQHALCAEALELLADQLFQIRRVVAEPALGKLRAIPIWIGFEDARHRDQCMFYHPNPRWLEQHGFPVELAGGIEVANAANFLQWTLDQPWMVLHELAHGYHHQVLGHGHDGIRAAFAAAKQQGLYEKVLRIGGSQERHYALTNDQEYFAEASEAYFGTNDFYPYVRSELKEYDGQMFAVLETVWGKRRR